jgi:hypothetical protein
MLQGNVLSQSVGLNEIFPACHTSDKGGDWVARNVTNLEPWNQEI